MGKELPKAFWSIMFIFSLSLTLAISAYFIGQNSHLLRTPKEWVLQVVIEDYEDTHGTRGMTSYHIQEHTIVDKDDLCGEYQCKVFEITIVDDGGKSHIYNALIACSMSSLNTFLNLPIPAERIIDLDTELTFSYYEWSDE